MAENDSIETKVALNTQAINNNTTMIDKHDTIILGLIATVQDLKTKFYVLGLAFPTILSVIGLLQAFGVFGVAGK